MTVTKPEEKMGLTSIKHEKVLLKQHAEFSEKWLAGRIKEDPSILGLGDVVVKELERPEPYGGRLDLLLYDPESERRFEVELMLGTVDESHIIRCIEYWDLERRRYPQYEHTDHGLCGSGVTRPTARCWDSFGSGPCDQALALRKRFWRSTPPQGAQNKATLKFKEFARNFLVSDRLPQ